jgi:hypothetical protein
MDVFSHLESNLAALERVCPDFHAWFREREQNWFDWGEKVFSNRQGWLDLWFSAKSSLLGIMPPGNFYAAWNPEMKGVKGASIICGCNLGYSLNALLGRTEAGHTVAVTDPHPEMLALCLGITDYRDRLLQGRLLFFPPQKSAQEKVLSGMDMQFYHGAVYFWADVPSMQIGPEYERLNIQCRDVLQKYKVQTGTLRRRQDTVVGNELDNYARAFRDGVLGRVNGTLSGRSAVVLGAGPSLEKFGPELAANRDRAVYAAGLQTLPALYRLGIKPHLCMAIDYTTALLKPFEKVDDNWLRDIPLIYSTKVHPRVVERYPGPRMGVWTRGGLGTLVFKDKNLLLDTGGSVNVALVRLFLEMGVDRMLFAGMDFGWKGESSHAPGHHAADLRRKNGAKGVEARKNADREVVYTTPSYLTSLWELEKTVAERPGVGFGNLFGGHMDISGSKRIAARDTGSFLGRASADVQENLAAMKEQARLNSSLPVFEKRAGQWAASFRRLLKRMDKLFTRPEKNEREIRRALGEMRLFVNQDPLYLTYLQPEIIDINGLEKMKDEYVRGDLVRVKQIVKRILKKIQHVDRTAGNADLRGAA